MECWNIGMMEYRELEYCNHVTIEKPKVDKFTGSTGSFLSFQVPPRRGLHPGGASGPVG
jgi:hypothetical protein